MQKLILGLLALTFSGLVFAGTQTCTARGCYADMTGNTSGDENVCGPLTLESGIAAVTLVSTSWTAGTVTLSIQNLDGTFRPHSTYTAEPDPSTLRLDLGAYDVVAILEASGTSGFDVYCELRPWF